MSCTLEREPAAKKEKTIAKVKAYSEISVRGKKYNQGKGKLEEILRVTCQCPKLNF